MSSIARGQITIVDLNDGKSINLFLSSTKPATQIFNKENSSYVPNYTASPFCVITPEVYVSGTTVNQVAQLKGVPAWKINGSTTLTTYGATAAATSPYALTIKSNLSVPQLSIECAVIYVDPDTGAETTAKAVYTITKTENAGQLICAIATAPNGTVFKNDQAATLKARCDMWRGSTIDNSAVSYTWYRNGTGAWVAITSANAVGITGYTTSEITIPASAVLNFESFKCSIKDTDTTSGTYNTVVSDIISISDMSDPYTVEITAPGGTVMTSGVTTTTLTANVWQNGNPVDSAWYTGATFTWRKFNKQGALETTWGTSGVKTGRSLDVKKEEVSVSATFTVDVAK